MNERNSVEVLYREIKILSVNNKILLALGVLQGTMRGEKNKFWVYSNGTCMHIL